MTGAIVALGYLIGMVSGPLLVPVGAFGVVTLGRVLAGGRIEGLVAGVALAVFACAVAIPALRWGTLDLGELRGVQAVLGPTVLVAPPAPAVAAWAGAAAGLVALGVWLGPPGAPGGWQPPAIAWWGFEALLGGLVLTTVFWGPAVAGWGTGAVRVFDVGSWFGAALLIGGCAAGLGWLRGRTPPRAPAAVLGAAGFVSVGAALVSSLAS